MLEIAIEAEHEGEEVDSVGIWERTEKPFLLLGEVKKKALRCLYIYRVMCFFFFF